MSIRPHFPTPGEMKKQFPIVKALTEKDFIWENMGNIGSNLIRMGIMLFIIFSIVAAGLRNNEYGDDWTEENVSHLTLIVGLFLMIVPFGFALSMGSESLQGTFKTISLYPIGINAIISSKLVYVGIVATAFSLIFIFSMLVPFWVMGMISFKFLTFFIMVTVLLLFAQFLCTMAGAFYSNLRAALTKEQHIPYYTSMGFLGAIMVSYWPVYVVISTFKKIFDPDGTYLDTEGAEFLAYSVGHLSPFEMAFHFSQHYILGTTLDLSFFLVIPIWLFIAYIGIKSGPMVYMDVFFRRA